MKRLYFSLLLLLSLFMVSAQETRWTGASADGSWSNANNWSDGVPSATTVAIFDNGTSITISNVQAATIGGIRITNNTKVKLTHNASIVLDIAHANSTSDLLIGNADGSELVIGNNINLTLASDTRTEIMGILSIEEKGSLNITNVNNSVVVRGSIINAGTIISNNNQQIEFSENAIYSHDKNGGQVPIAKWDAGSTCIIKGVTTAAPSGLNQTFGNYQWNCPAQLGGFTLGIAIPADIRGNLSISKVGATASDNVFVQLPTGNVRIDGDFELQDGIMAIVSTITNINLAGNFMMTGGIIRCNASNNNSALNLNFCGKQKQLFRKTGGSIDKLAGTGYTCTNNFNLKPGSMVDFGNSILNGNGNFTVEADASMMIGHPQGINLSGNLGNIQLNGSRNYSNLASYIYSGQHAQVTGTGLPTIVRSLVIDNSSGVDFNSGVLLTHALTIRQELSLKNGYLQTSIATMLSFNEEAVAISEGNSFVAGPMQKTGNTPFRFPTGWAGSNGGYIPIDISELSGSTTIQAEYKRATATTVGTTINTPLHHVSYCEYWELFAVSGAPTAKVSLHWNSHSSCNPVSYISNFSSLRVAQYKHGLVKAWTDAGNKGGSLADGILHSQSLLSLNANEAKYFTMASISTANSPLPVFFDNVMANEKDGAVEVSWNNLTERDIAMYFVERSVNGRDYSVIGQYLPKSNRDEKASYQHLDIDPSLGSNFYRIKVLERSSSKIIFSKVIRVDIGPKILFSIYPNPVTGNQFSITMSGIKSGTYKLRLLNNTGQQLYQTVIVSHGTSISRQLTLPAQVLPGIYRMVIQSDAFAETRLLSIQ